MTESHEMTSSPTLLAALLGSAAGTGGAAPLELTEYRGRVSARKLDARERETAALATGAAVHDLDWLRRVAVRGEDRFRWLNGMVTNGVNGLATNGGAWNLVLNAQGRIQGELYIWREGDELEMEIAADQHEKLLEHLNRFIIMDDVELVSLNDETAVGLSGPLSGEVLARLELPVPQELLTSARGEWNGTAVRVMRSYGVLTPHYELWVKAAQLSTLWTALTGAGATAVGTEALEAMRVAEGIPLYGIDMVERDLPQETSQMRALHFSKGCYLGQEVVERIRSRGNVHRHLRQLEILGPLPEAGTELSFQNAAGTTAAAGTITSAAELALEGRGRIFALGMIRGEAELSGQEFTFIAGESTGIARIMDAAPILDTEH